MPHSGPDQTKMSRNLKLAVIVISEVMGKTFQAAQLTHESQTLHLQTRDRWKFSLGDSKKIFCRSDSWSKISGVLVVQLETFSP